MQQSMPNHEDISDLTTAIDMALVLMAKAFKLNDTTPTNNNQTSSSNPCNRQAAQPGMNMGQDRQMLVVKDIGGNQFRQYAKQNSGNQIWCNAVQNNGNGTVAAARAEGNSNRNSKNQIRCYNCQGVGHYAGNCTVKPRKRDAAYLQIQLQIAQKEEGVIQLNLEEFDFMADQASTSGTQTDKAPVYDSNRSTKCGNSGGIVEQHPATVEETRAYFESLYNNLAIEVEKVNMVNRKMKETNADLTTELARYKGQEKSFEINKAKFVELKTGYRKSVYQEQCLTKKINALHLKEKKKLKSDFKTREDEFLDKQIQYEKKIKELDNILVKTGQSIQTMHMLSPKPDSFYHTEQKMAQGYQNHFYLKQAQQKQQSFYNGRVLLEKYDPPVVYDSEETLQLAQDSRLKMKQLNKEIKPANYAKKLNI
ncbi:copia protein [Tanacetum coccineum]